MDITFSSKYTLLTTAEVHSLYNFIKNTKGSVIELGRLHGGSTKIILKALENTSRKLYSIDITDRPLLAFYPEDKKLYNNLVKITANSITYKPTKIYETIFIDSNHSYQHISKELKNWWNSIYKYFIFHDYRNKTYRSEGVKIIVDYLIKENYLKKISLTDTLYIAEKNNENNLF